MTVAIVAGVLGLAAVLIAYYRDPPIAEQRVVQPDWDLLPDPSDLARTDFPLAIPGYEAASVEIHFDTLSRAYADLLASATPDVIARARHRAAVRQGIELPNEGVDEPATPARVSPIADRSTVNPLSVSKADSEALQAEAALADLDAQQGNHRD
jgi:hypothetical protein